MPTVPDERVLPPLGMTGEQFEEAALSTAKGIEEYFASLPSRNTLPSVAPGYLRKLLPESAPNQGEAWTEIEKDIERAIMPGITHWQSPKYAAFFPASTTYPSMLGEFWSAALSSPAFNWICSPVITELETVVMDWFANILALPETFLSKTEGGGVLQLSASDTIVTVMVAARERYIRRQLEREGVTDPEEIEDRSCEIRSKLVALGSEQSHSSTKKAAIIAGTRCRTIPTHQSDDYALTGPALRAKIEELHAKGLQPYYLTVTLGTTNTCAIDAFDSLAAVAKDYPDIWIHCDAAYAGSALILPEYQHFSAQMAFVDSFNMNMHKWLMVNFDASLLYVQKRRDLTDTLSITPAYLRNQFSDSGLVTDYRDWQIPLGRRFRSLKVWFVIRTFGVQGLRAQIRHSIALGDFFADLVRSRSDLFTIVAPPRFALTVFTVNPRRKEPEKLEDNTGNGTDPRPYQDSQVSVKPAADSKEVEEANEVTKAVYETIDQEKEFFLTSTVLSGVYAIRVVSANPLAEEKYVRQIFDTLVRTAKKVLKSRDGKQANGASH
ncbi:uncharacterized protein LTR77_007457 [Saxophila tyrrhenica]|uniref:Aromatic-L-amino-acid decarboxylase n=1 Tax=Saxophila tyrrhenica TaxID=1690608 RepID=A0AAV9P576_9PEZI|nr:hypothetical protein LTR77_007457 [Saxophila tyrrhenica]